MVVNSDKKQLPEQAPPARAGVVFALMLLGAWIGYAQAGRISDTPTQSLWIAQGVFYGSVLFATFSAFFVLCFAQFRVRLSFILELVVVTAFLSLFYVSLIRCNSDSQERAARMQQIQQEFEESIIQEQTRVKP